MEENEAISPLLSKLPLDSNGWFGGGNNFLHSLYS
jgi:hypothetical protein